MNIFAASDYHLSKDQKLVYNEEADVIVFAGDLCDVDFKLNTNKPILFVPGNHDYYGYDFNLRQQYLKQSTNVIPLIRTSYLLENVAFIGCTLWTDMKVANNIEVSKIMAPKTINDFTQIKNWSVDKMLDENEKDFKFIVNEVERLKSEGYKVVVITHHPPSRKSLDDRYPYNNEFFVSEYDQYVLYSKIDLWIHGHIHINSNYILGDTQVFCNPAGIRYSNREFTTKMVEI